MNEIEIKALWKQTNQEPLGLTIEALHQKSLAFHRKVWRQDKAELMGWAIVTLVFGFQIGAAPNALTRSGELLAIASAIIAAFHLRRYATTRPSDASTGSSLLTFHISELHRRRDLLRSVWRWIVVPMMISLWVILAGFVQARPGSAGTLLTFACVMTGIGLVLTLANVRGARRLQQGIDALLPLGTYSPNSNNQPRLTRSRIINGGRSQLTGSVRSRPVSPSRCPLEIFVATGTILGHLQNDIA
jgi:hypothetical protein